MKRKKKERKEELKRPSLEKKTRSCEIQKKERKKEKERKSEKF